MPERVKIIESYLLLAVNRLKSNGIIISSTQVNNALNKLSNSEDSLEEIKEKIDKYVELLLESADFDKREDFRNLDLKYNGITLNIQDIELMKIARASSKEELNVLLKEIKNLEDSELDITSDSFEDARIKVFQAYLDSLTSKEEYFKDSNISLSKRINHLRLSTLLDEEELVLFDEILESSMNVEEIMKRLEASFDSEKLREIFTKVKEIHPVEKSGIKSTNITSIEGLLKLLDSYDSVTIDEEVKYGNVSLYNGEFDFSRLKESLDFVKGLGKEVKLNALIFYMDCPEHLYNLPKSEENKRLVKSSLLKYVDETTKFIRDNGYADTVRSIDVFNELLNRFPLQGDTPYLYRGDIPKEDNPDDNTKAGWLKHLNIEDLCDIISIARRNLPQVDFMFNDDNLIDPKKIDANMVIIRQIQEYEKLHGVKLIDSIGTQMHIDNNVTKEEIRNMFLKLGTLGLPIEISEFDLAMTSGVDSLTDAEIEEIRRQKIIDIFEVVQELKDQIDIRGFTIWSKTDKQNFRVTLENEKRARNGEKLIETLHGGMYTESMEPKGKRIVKSSTYNYHTHTRRCGHAEDIDESFYVDAARESGIKTLGFSDHVPYTDLEYPNTQSRMFNRETSEYIESIKKLKEANPDMTILCGFEAEYDILREGYLGELRKSVDYLILGQHYVNNGLTTVQQKNNPEYPIEYAKLVCRALDSGLFDIVAHPDIFMQYRDTLETPEGKKRFMENALVASKMICEKAKELNIPIEINFGGINSNRKYEDNEFQYPHPIFWNIAAKVGCSVLYGIDAHTPESILNSEISRRIANNAIDVTKLNLVPFDYNIIEARKNNTKVQDLLAEGQSEALSYEASLVNLLLTGVMGVISNNASPDMIRGLLEEFVKRKKDDLSNVATANDQKVLERIEKISSSTSLSPQDKAYRLERTKQAIPEINQVLHNQSALFERMNDSVTRAFEMGCSTKEEFKNVIVLLTEEKVQTNEEKKTRARSKINGFIESKKENQSMVTDKPKILERKTNNNNQGFIKTLSLSMIIGGIIGITLGILFVIMRVK